MTAALQATAHATPFKPGDSVIYLNRHIGTLTRINHEYRNDHWFVKWFDGMPTRLPVFEGDLRILTDDDMHLAAAGVGIFSQDIQDTLNAAQVTVPASAATKVAKALKLIGYRVSHEVNNRQTLGDLAERAMSRGGQLVVKDKLGETWIFTENEDGTRVITTPHPEYYDALTIEHIHLPVRVLDDGMNR